MTKNSKAIARSEAIRAKNNRHVKWLTINRNTKCPRTGEILWKTREELKEAQFHLRRAWAETLLHIMKHEIGISWSKMHEFSGRTRQSWINVTNALWMNEEEREHPEQFGNYRPVTNGFIKNVTNTLEGKWKYRLYTSTFVDCWLLGLEIDQNNGHQQGFVRNRLETKAITNGWGPLDVEQTDFSDWAVNNISEPNLFAIRSEGSKMPKLVGAFPLLEVNDDSDGQIFAWEYLLHIEETVFPNVNPKTGEPDIRAVNSHSMWFQTSEHSPLDPERRMADVRKFTEDPHDYTVNQVRDMIEREILDPMQGNEMIQQLERVLKQEEIIADVEAKEDDFDEFSEDLNQFHDDHEHRLLTEARQREDEKPTDIQVRKTDATGEDIISLPFEVHPAFLDETLSGSVEFTVKIKYKEGVKVGHMIECTKTSSD